MTRTIRSAAWLSCLLLLPLLPLLAGCGRKGPPLGRVSGTVTLNGQPLANALVTFQPQEKGGSPSTARTNDKGYYELMFSADTPGAMLGKHKVTVSTYRQEAQPNGIAKEVPETVSAKYTNQLTTPLVKEVGPGSNTIDLELKP